MIAFSRALRMNELIYLATYSENSTNLQLFSIGNPNVFIKVFSIYPYVTNFIYFDSLFYLSVVISLRAFII